MYGGLLVTEFLLYKKSGSFFSVGPILKFIFGLRDRKAYKKNSYQYSYTKITRNSFNNSTVTLSYQSGISPSPPPWKKIMQNLNRLSFNFHENNQNMASVHALATHQRTGGG